MKARTPDRIGAIVGDLAAVEEIFALKDLMTRLGVANLDCRQDGAALDPKWGRASYLFNATIAGIEQADALLIVGANPRKEAAVLNARIRKRWRAGNFPIGLIGEKADLTYATIISAPGRRRWPRSPPAATPLPTCCKKAERPLILLGPGRAGAAGRRGHRRARRQGGDRARRREGRLERLFGAAHARPRASARSTSASCRARAGSTPRRWRRSARSTCCSCSAPTRSTSRPAPSSSTSAPTATAARIRADVILPGAAYPEKSGIYVNTEGRVQMAARAAFPPGDAREDWAILRALSDVLGKRLPYDSLAQLRQALFKAHPHLARIDQIAPGDPADIAKLAALGGTPDKAPFRSPVDDFYLTNPIARASAVMAECSALAEGRAALTAAE